MVLAHFQMAKHYENILKLFTEANVAIPFLSLFFLTDDCTCLKHSGLVCGNWSVGEGQQASTRHECLLGRREHSWDHMPSSQGQTVMQYHTSTLHGRLGRNVRMSLWREEEQRFAKQLVVRPCLVVKLKIQKLSFGKRILHVWSIKFKRNNK